MEVDEENRRVINTHVLSGVGLQKENGQGDLVLRGRKTAIKWW